MGTELRPFEQKIHAALVSKSYHNFAFGIPNPDGTRTRYLYTKDEHDHESPIKYFPDLLYLKTIGDLLVVSGGIIRPDEAEHAIAWGIPLSHLEHLYETRLLAIEKSRQLMITWIVLSYLLWRAKYREHQLIMIQSKKADDANVLVCERKGDRNSRIGVMEDMLPPFLKSIDFERVGAALKGEMNFPNGSKLEAIPEGGSKIRSRTPSVFFSDEAAFQPSFGEAYKAALPAVVGGGQGIFVSSAEISTFQELVDSKEDDFSVSDSQIDMTMIEGGMRAGLTTRIAPSGLFVCRLHYSADPGKNPMTPRGAAWLNRTVRSYPGGVEGPAWRKEMEIEYSAGGGEFVFRNLRRWRSESRIFVPIHDIDLTRATIWASYDHGFTNPCCYLVHAVYPREDDVWYASIWEFYAAGLNVPDIAKVIKGESIILPDGRHFEGNPYANKEVLKICDPAIDGRNQVNSAGETKKLIDLFGNEGVYFTKGERGDDVTVADYMLGVLWADPWHPKYQIATCCENFIWELSRLQHKVHKSAAMITEKNAPEGLVDRDNHAWDAWKYFIKRFPMGYVKRKDDVQGGSYAWWMDLSKMPLRQAVRSSYRRV